MHQHWSHDKHNREFPVSISYLCKVYLMTCICVLLVHVFVNTGYMYMFLVGIIHSDLKPSNFLLIKGKLKLIDFGIAKAIQQDKTSIITDCQVGTLNYMSPETIQEHCGLSDPSDGKLVFKVRAARQWAHILAHETAQTHRKSSSRSFDPGRRSSTGYLCTPL